jgi:dTDP-4-dehydrorhamnose reductase
MQIRRLSELSTVWVLGAHGMLGLAVHHQLKAQGWAVCGLTRHQLDALRLQPRVIPLRADDVVVNCIGLINRRLKDSDESAYLKVNSLFPRLLAGACVAAGAHLIHISTDCVFSGTGAPHDEGALPNATDLYGQSKSWGEPEAALVLRSSIIGPEYRHHYSLMCWFLQHTDGGQVTGYTNHLWNGMTTLQMARCIEQLVEQGFHRRHGLLHLHSPDVSKHDVLVMLGRTFARRIEVRAEAAPVQRDMRLASQHREVLEGLRVPALAQQIDDLRTVSSPMGHWSGLTA